MKKYLFVLTEIFKKVSTWFFIAAVVFSAGVGFTISTLIGGNSKLAETFNFILIALVFMLPILANENRFTGKLSTADILSKFFAILTVGALSLFPTLMFAAVIGEYGGFKWQPFICNLISALCLCSIYTAVFLFITSRIGRKSRSYIVSYIVVAAVMLCEVLCSFLSSSLLTSILSLFTLTKYFGVYALDIVDVRTVLLAVIFPILLVLTNCLKDEDKFEGSAVK